MAWTIGVPVIVAHTKDNFILSVGLVSDASALVEEDLFDHLMNYQKELLKGKFLNTVGTQPDAEDAPAGVYSVGVKNDAGVALSLTGRLVDTDEVGEVINNSIPKAVMGVYKSLLLSLSTLGDTKRTTVVLEFLRAVPQVV